MQIQIFNRFIEAIEHLQAVRNRDHFAAPIACRVAVGAVDRQHEFRPSSHRQFHFAWMKAVDRNTASRIPQRLDARTYLQPRIAGLAPHVNHVRAIRLELERKVHDGRYGQPRRMVDFSHDLDRVVLQVGRQHAALSKSEILGQLPEIARSTLDRHAQVLLKRFQFAAAVARQEHPRGRFGYMNVASNPLR